MRARNKLLLGLAVAIGASATILGPAALASGEHPVDKLLAAVSDPMAILSGRSPGARGSATVQTKFAVAPAARDKPRERVLSGVRQRPAAPPATPVEQAENLIDQTLAPPPGMPGDPVLALGEAPLGRTSGPGIGGGPLPLLVPTDFGGGGSSGGGSTGGDVPEPIPTSPAPVPEPSTWVTLILGFGLIGARLRRREAPSKPERIGSVGSHHPRAS